MLQLLLFAVLLLLPFKITPSFIIWSYLKLLRLSESAFLLIEAVVVALVVMYISQSLVNEIDEYPVMVKVHSLPPFIPWCTFSNHARVSTYVQVPETHERLKSVTPNGRLYWTRVFEHSVPLTIWKLLVEVRKTRPTNQIADKRNCQVRSIRDFSGHSSLLLGQHPREVFTMKQGKNAVTVT